MAVGGFARGLSALLVAIQVLAVCAAPNCPLIGPEFPAPKNLLDHPQWKKAIENLTNIFEWIDVSNVTGADKFSYSIQVFSTNPGPPILYERHHTQKDLPKNTTGVKKVDGNTVYRLGSVTKVFTVLAWLAELGDVHWTQPITNYIPELKEYVGKSSSATFDQVRETDWDDITIGALASQVSGLGRDYGVLGELTETQDAPNGWQIGFPPLSNSSLPPCGAWPLCSRKQFFDGLKIMYPSFAPWTTPTYSNVAYQLLAYALENISGKNFTDVLQNRVVKALNLNSTYYTTPPDSVGILPGTNRDTYWDVSLGGANPGGNMYSSAADLSALGRAILTSKLTRPAIMRRWLNPVTHSSDVLASVGAPWGVRRIQLDKDRQPHRTLSVFTKAGTFKKYTAFITLLKDFNLGFTIMMAGNPGISNFGGADLMGQNLIPAYDAIAREEANTAFGGQYVGSLLQNGTNVNSSLTISTDPAKPGLGVGPWISNGTNMVNMALMLQSGSNSSGRNPEVRLYYTQLEKTADDGSKRQAWKAIFEDTAGKGIGQQMFSTDCGSWVQVTGVTYASMPLDEFVFNLDKNGNAISVENLALRMKLYRVGGPLNSTTPQPVGRSPVRRGKEDEKRWNAMLHGLRH